MDKNTTIVSNTDALQARLLEMQIAELERQKNEREKSEKDALELILRQREIGLKAMLQEDEQKKLNQAQCSHKKPNGLPNIGGQRDHRQHYHWICSYCSKEWTDNELPLDLRISQDLVGGPVIV